MEGLLGLALLCVMGLAQAHVSQAQNSPQNFLDLHNNIRKVVGVGPLKWDTTLEAYARDYAKVRSKDCELIHSNGPYGENIYWGFGEGFTDGKAAMKLWADEKEYYDYESNSCADGKECLHYTQIVWKNSKRLGCARARCHDDYYFITCNYDPPGNINGEKPF